MSVRNYGENARFVREPVESAFPIRRLYDWRLRLVSYESNGARRDVRHEEVTHAVRAFDLY